jgi:hypothetical protein
LWAATELGIVGLAVILGEWKSPEGAASVNAVMTDVLIILMSGYLDAQTGNKLAGKVHQYLLEATNVHTFWDLGPLTRYDADVRTRSIQVLLDHRRQIASMHAFGEAENVRMGILTARIALGEHLQNLHVHDVRKSFDDALAALLARAPG